MKDINDWLSTKQASERLGITLRTLYRLIDEGQVPAYKFGRVIRLKTVEVDEFIEAARVGPGDLGHLYPDAAEGVKIGPARLSPVKTDS